MTVSAPTLEWTESAQANVLIAADPLALLIGFCLDQQIPVEKAFCGPLVMRERLGTLDARKLARIDATTFETAFRTPPAIHRFPASMAERVHRLCGIIAAEYGNRAERVWNGAADAAELTRRLRALPGFGEMKARIVSGVLAKHFAVKLEGWEREIPQWPSLADVRTREERRQYQAGKRAYKAGLKAQHGGA
ncbi:MAG: HhH-GPD-type base excision DNA repair protein [Candidatus Dormibacteria bacterium]